MSLIDHLDELRVRLIRYVVILMILVLGCYGFRKEILDLIRMPVEGPLERYSQSIKDPLPESPDQAVFKDLDQYDCNCSRSLKTHELSLPQTVQTAPVEVTPDFPLAEPPKVEGLLDQIREGHQIDWTALGDQAIRDFRAIYYSAMGDDKKAATIYQGKENQGPPPEQTYYQDDQGQVLELSCRCVRDNAQAKTAHMVYIGLPELFFAQMKVSMYAALFLSFPFLMIEIWGFAGPALYKDEKLVFWGFGLSTFVFFTGGALFGYFVVFPYGFDFFLSLSQPGEIMPSLAIGEYLDFTIKLFLAFGLIFELPVAVFILARLGIITPMMMVQNSRVALVVVMIVSAVLTPPDPFTMFLMAGPLIVLYIISIGVCFIGLNKKKATLRAQGINPEEL
ncbi:MAG: twin arginine-targeting protein translocase TatC [Candidatus Lambdaproteobacteria bacterium RIFOXYD12_FULL_49_8]|nr:MAG: twin arginine-targeting protein translocase TatC [Candidatus Lambdaproteobacteria bacterium RIFOXYD12_FULL_49_8]